MGKKYLQIILLVLLIIGSPLAGDKIKLKLHQPPPNKMPITSLWKLDIENTTKDNLTIYLGGTASGEKQGMIVEGKTNTFSVKPGKSTYGYDDFKSGEVNWMNKTIQEVIFRTGEVPSDVYTICVTAYYENGQIADVEQCITHPVERPTEGMITLISPSDGEEIDAETGLNFMWVGTGLKGPYTFQIVEIKKGQTPEQAFKENRMFYEKDKIANTSFMYPIEALKMEEGKKYAWVIKDGGLTSEVWTFQLLTAQPDYCNYVRFSLQQVPSSPWCFNVIANVNQAIFWTSVKLESTTAIFSSYSNVLNGWNAGTNPGTPPYTVLEFSKGSSGSALPLGITTVAQICVNVTEPTTFHLFYSADGIPPCDTTLTADYKSDSCNCKGEWNSKYKVDYTNSQGNLDQYSNSCDNFSNTPFEVKRNTPLTFTAYTGYNCLPSNPPCLEYRWKVIEQGNPVPFNQGTSATPIVTFPASLPSSPPDYTFIIYAYCGENLCDSCGFNFSVKDSVQDSCKCNGDWDSKYKVDYTNSQGNLDQYSNSCNYFSNTPFEVRQNTNLTYTALTGYNYLPSNTPCLEYRWKVIEQGNPVPFNQGTSTNPTVTFLANLPVSPPNYTFIIYVYCGDNLCDSCGFNFIVKTEKCDCGYWKNLKGPILMETWGGKTPAFSCGSTYTIKNSNSNIKILNIRDIYICPVGCPVHYTWEIRDISNIILYNGTGTQIDYSALNFVLPLKYTVLFYPWCDGVKCEPCKLNVIIKKGFHE